MGIESSHMTSGDYRKDVVYKIIQENTDNINNLLNF